VIVECKTQTGENITYDITENLDILCHYTDKILNAVSNMRWTSDTYYWNKQITDGENIIKEMDRKLLRDAYNQTDK